MKTKLLIICLFLSMTSIAQVNRSFNNVTGNFTGAIPGQQFSTTPAGSEIFRFQPGYFSQLQSGTDFGFGNQWFSMGRVVAGTQDFYGLRFQRQNRALVMGYTSTSLNDPRIEWIGESASGTLGDLDFRVGTSFGSPGIPGTFIQVAKMTRFGNTIFGTSNPFGITATSPKVGINADVNQIGLDVRSGTTAISAAGTQTGLNSTGNIIGVAGTSNSGTGVVGTSSSGTGVRGTSSIVGVVGEGSTGVRGTGSAVSNSVGVLGTGGNIAGSIGVSGSGNTFGVRGTSDSSTGVYGSGKIGVTGKGQSRGVEGLGESTGVFGEAKEFGVVGNGNIGVYGTTLPSGSGFTAGIYGDTGNVSAGFGSNIFAGYFNGDIATTAGFYSPSDAKFKNDVLNETNILEKINQLRPVNYTYKTIEGITLSIGKQHGFISQELAEVFPELTKDIAKPVINKDNKVTSTIEYKAINYAGLISILTAGIQELNNELIILKEEFAEYKANDNVRKNLTGNQTSGNFVLEQNIPNPFSGQTSVKFKLPAGSNQAEIAVFDLNGRLIKSYPVSQNAGEVIIQSSEIGQGLFLYSLIINGAEILTKKMIVK